MKKFYKITILVIVLIFLTTYSPSELNFSLNKKNVFFKVQNIKILNNYLIQEEEIKEKLNNIYNKNIFFIKGNDIEEPLKSINFLEKIEVNKKYPSTLIIKVYETRPIAILFNKNGQFILDSSSNSIAFDKRLITGNFPSVFGERAEDNFINFFKKLENNNFPIQRVKNFFYFQIGRWDIQLLNDKIIKFPLDQTREAIQQSIKLLYREDFKNFNIIDLRIHGKIVVE